MLFIGYGTINPPIYGQLYALLNVLYNNALQSKNALWTCIHPSIIRSSKDLYLSGYYANAAQDAFIEINNRLKKLYRQLKPEEKDIPDGVEMMNKIFSDKCPIMEVCDRSTDTGFNIHNGTRFMLVGAIAALRNPKAHSNSIKLTREEAMRRLMFASMLMYRIDEAVAYSGIRE